MSRICTYLAVTLLAWSAAAAQGLPVKIHRDITAFQGDKNAAILVDGATRYALVSAHKEGGRPWADAVFWRVTDGQVTWMNRRYDCAAGTYRWLGEAEDYAGMSRSVTSLEELRDRPLQPGTVEYALAHHVCGL